MAILDLKEDIVSFITTGQEIGLDTIELQKWLS